MRNSKAIRFFDFSGGLNTYSPATSADFNQASDLQNINIVGEGQKVGFEARRGNTALNAALASGAAIHGLGYFRKSDLTDFLVVICGTTIQTSPVSATFTDRTAALTITTGQDNLWLNFTMNDLIIFVGGNRAADVPIKWSGSGNAAVLGGTPPVGSFGLTGNNRAFIGNTVANPSTIYWSILGNPEDWSGVGSGNQDISKNDGDTLVGAARLGIDHLFLFKQNSIHDLVIRTAPFPVFEVRRGHNLGAVSPRGIVAVDNLIYYITPEPRMRCFDGNNIISYSPEHENDINTTWDGLNKARLKYIKGVYYPHLRQIHWLCSNGSSSTHNLSIIWDLNHKCWLQHPTGFKMNDAVLAQDRVLYTGGYDGIIYQQDVAATYTDASETAPGAISAYWRSGWMDFEDMLNRKSIPYVQTNFKTQSSGTFDFGYGYDFSPDRAVASVNMVTTGAKYDSAKYDVDVYGGQSDITRFNFMKGNGKYYQFLVRHNGTTEGFYFNGIEIPVKETGVGAQK